VEFVRIGWWHRKETALARREFYDPGLGLEDEIDLVIDSPLSCVDDETMGTTCAPCECLKENEHRCMRPVLCEKHRQWVR